MKLAFANPQLQDPRFVWSNQAPSAQPPSHLVQVQASEPAPLISMRWEKEARRLVARWTMRGFR